MAAVRRGKLLILGTELFQVNKHVGNLSRYLPFDADFDQLFEEHADPDGASIDLETRAQEVVANLVEEGPTLVVLTGDAGHGKTHLCRRLLETSLGMSRADAFQTIRERSDGTVDLGATLAGRCLRIIRDLSEMSPALGAARLAEASWVPVSGRARGRGTARRRPRAIRGAPP